MTAHTKLRSMMFLILAWLAYTATAQAGAKILFIAGPGSHGYGAHEFRAGCLLLAKQLNAAGLDIEAVVSEAGWPSDEKVFDDVATVVMMCTGEDKHLLNYHLPFFDKLADRGIGLVNIHTSVITIAGEAGDHFLKWAGGYHELYYSMVAHWQADFQSLPNHPITRGVNPFVFNDEWYYFMRFTPDMKGVTPILSAHPNPADIQKKKPGKLGGADEVRAAINNHQIQHVAWAYEREGPGRGFSFTGAHDHWYFADPNYRKLVLNAIAWTANIDIPHDGVPIQKLTINDLLDNQDDQPTVGMTLDDLLQKYPVKPNIPAADINFTPRLPLQWSQNASKTKIAFVAGNRSADYGHLEQYATSTLLANQLSAAYENVDVQVFTQPYPKDMYDKLAQAAAVIFYPSEYKANPFDKGAKPMRDLFTGDAGIISMASGFTVSPGGGSLLAETIGARGEEEKITYVEQRVAFNDYPAHPAHPASRGLTPFNVQDAWLTPLEYSPAIDHATVILKDKNNTPLLWLIQSPAGNRRVGFTGGHHHFALSNPLYRKAILNAIAWAAKLPIPQNGVPTAPLSFDTLTKNQNHTLPVYIDKAALMRRFEISQ